LSLLSAGPAGYTGLGGNLSAGSPPYPQPLAIFQPPANVSNPLPCTIDQSPVLGRDGITLNYTGYGNCSNMLNHTYTLLQVPPPNMEFVNWTCSRVFITSTTFSSVSSPDWIAPATIVVKYNTYRSTFRFVCVAAYKCPDGTTWNVNSMDCRGMAADISVIA
jgi:hypothetical protein